MEKRQLGSICFWANGVWWHHYLDRRVCGVVVVVTDTPPTTPTAVMDTVQSTVDRPIRSG